ncbi:Serine/threonine protein kinase [Paractinoplanes atraurantiacus]|uniref:non-specific serine/threonine protein kinase n=1 Tax=Paractinoplanes atraurantiacus TaxID=1036182 RepID=A0A285FDC7_9ACTN|nr:Serine/threonine protein kinase [Actinoplanes atraurantiacus]
MGFGCAIFRRDGHTATVEVRETLGGRYKLLGELGSGGMAVVWRARDEVLGRRVAVKVLAARFAGDPQSRARIRDEARAAATLSHPNIAQVYDFGEASETGTPLPYVVMELINGPTLQQRVASGPLPPRKVFRICGEVAAALAAAHADGLVHRDIKMANIMVTPSGAKVVDFGIAAAVGLEPEEMLVGTPAYLAPERLAGAAVEPASDVYALGVLLYRLLAHESPWSVESTTQMLRAHVYVEPAPLPELPGVPPGVADLITRCLRKDPTERPTASEVSVTLADAAEAFAVRDEARETPTRIPSPASPADDARADSTPPPMAAPSGGAGTAGNRRRGSGASDAGSVGGQAASDSGGAGSALGRGRGGSAGGRAGAGAGGAAGGRAGSGAGGAAGGSGGWGAEGSADVWAGAGAGGSAGGRAGAGGEGSAGGRAGSGVEGAASGGRSVRRAGDGPVGYDRGRAAAVTRVQPGESAVRGRAAGGGLRRVPLKERKWLMAGGAAAALTVAGLAAWGLAGDERGERRQQAVVAPTSPGPAASRGLGSPTTRATQAAQAPIVTPPAGQSATVASGPPPSVGPSQMPIVPSDSLAPTPSDTAEAPPPASAAPPEGKRIGSAGGSVHAVCEQGKARLTSWEPAPGYTAKEVEAGPAFTARILFATADTEVEAGKPAKKYRITVTCVAGQPTPVVLPL